MKKLIGGIFLVLFILAAGTFAVLLFTGVINVDGIQRAEKDDYDTAAYISYMDSYVLLDGEGMVAGTASEKPQGGNEDEIIPMISGLRFSNVIIGQPLQAENIADLSYIMKVLKELKNNDIRDVSEIYISADSEITLYTGNVKILLGAEQRVAEKISDLRDFYSDVAKLSGTLNMQQVSDMSSGYTFKTYGN